MKKSAFKFSSFQEPTLSPFEKLFNIFKELIIHTSGDFDEAIEWLKELDKEYKLTDENYTIDDGYKKKSKNAELKVIGLLPNNDGKLNMLAHMINNNLQMTLERGEFIPPPKQFFTNGQVDQELFRQDVVHLNQAGYKRFNQVLESFFAITHKVGRF